MMICTHPVAATYDLLLLQEALVICCLSLYMDILDWMVSFACGLSSKTLTMQLVNQHYVIHLTLMLNVLSSFIEGMAIR